MASASKPKLEPETPEEMMERKRMIMGGGHTKGGGYNHGLEGTEIMMNRDGTNGFSLGNDLSDQYKWNEKTGDYRSHGGGIMNIAEMPTAPSTGLAGSTFIGAKFLVVALTTPARTSKTFPRYMGSSSTFLGGGSWVNLAVCLSLGIVP